MNKKYITMARSIRNSTAPTNNTNNNDNRNNTIDLIDNNTKHTNIPSEQVLPSSGANNNSISRLTASESKSSSTNCSSSSRLSHPVTGNDSDTLSTSLNSSQHTSSPVIDTVIEHNVNSSADSQSVVLLILNPSMSESDGIIPYGLAHNLHSFTPNLASNSNGNNLSNSSINPGSRQHVDTLDIILGGDGTRESQKDEENIQDPTKNKTEKPRTQGNNDTCPAPNTTTEDQRGALAARKEKHPKIDGKQETKPYELTSRSLETFL
ncbi:Hypothetical predicted protein [Octopus vulgaris]|uniref:Uncharacterized protein n=1 Tax=Octopus vulgaris TaxID=6645 RepID=A0AA36F031_OCTVU|nr:Hypothetical predicted protein [Octopus vulgaris]